jgi:hypothetical protein
MVMLLVQSAILEVGQLNFTPGMPGYGQKLHEVLEKKVRALNDPELLPEQVYLSGERKTDATIPLGASVVDIAYGPPGHPLIVFEVKTGKATDISAAYIVMQRAKAWINLPPGTLYEYVLVYRK